jgi:hypothetical protein
VMADAGQSAVAASGSDSDSSMSQVFDDGALPQGPPVGDADGNWIFDYIYTRYYASPGQQVWDQFPDSKSPYRYFVMWKGYPDMKDGSWEPQESFFQTVYPGTNIPKFPQIIDFERRDGIEQDRNHQFKIENRKADSKTVRLLARAMQKACRGSADDAEDPFARRVKTPCDQPRFFSLFPLGWAPKHAVRISKFRIDFYVASDLYCWLRRSASPPPYALCAVLCCAVLCCAALCCAALRCAALRCAPPCPARRRSHQQDGHGHAGAAS